MPSSLILLVISFACPECALCLNGKRQVRGYGETPPPPLPQSPFMSCRGCATQLRTSKPAIRQVTGHFTYTYTLGQKIDQKLSANHSLRQPASRLSRTPCTAGLAEYGVPTVFASVAPFRLTPPRLSPLRDMAPNGMLCSRRGNTVELRCRSPDNTLMRPLPVRKVPLPPNPLLGLYGRLKNVVRREQRDIPRRM